MTALILTLYFLVLPAALIVMGAQLDYGDLA